MDQQIKSPKTIGQAIDELINALSAIDKDSRLTVISAACAHLNIKMPATGTAVGSLSSEITAVPPGVQQTPAQIADIKSFRGVKQPTSANEMAATVAYFLSEIAPGTERKPEVDTDDMVRYFKQAGFPLPKAPRMLLTNAKNSGYFDSGSSGGYKLNPVGYNLVAHNLPRASSGGTPQVHRRKLRASTGAKKNRASGHRH